MTRKTIYGRESRVSALTSEDYRLLESSPRFRALAAEGYASLVVGRSPDFGLRGTSYIGQAVLENGVRLLIEPKFEGVLQALLPWAITDDIRESESIVPVGPSVGLQSLLGIARRYANVLTEYVQRGRLREYKNQSFVTSTPRGRIDVRETVRIRARGRVGQVVVVRPTLTANIEVHRLLFRANSVAAALLHESPADRCWLKKVRLAADVFNAADSAELALRTPGEMASAMAAAQKDRFLPQSLRDALAYGRALILGLGRWPTDYWEEGPKGAVFINLATLWENAVREAARTLVAPDRQVHRRVDKAIFIARKKPIEANPDLVITAPNGTVLVADCKYKPLDASAASRKAEPSLDDVYQIYAHCSASACTKALLIYPGLTAARREFGIAPSGVEIGWATVRPGALVDDLRTLVTELSNDEGRRRNSQAAGA